MSFCRIAADDLSSYLLDGIPISEHDPASLRQRAAARGLPNDVLQDDAVLRILIAALLGAGGAEKFGASRGAGKAVSSGILSWVDVREEAKTFLLASIKREGIVSSEAAETLNMLNKPLAVEGFKKFGNRWTVAADDAERNTEHKTRRHAYNLTSEELAAAQQGSASKTLTDSAPARPWYRSKMVLAVLVVAAFFVLVHIALLLRVLVKVHKTDSHVLLLPVVGLSASALVAAFAIGVNKLSGA